MRVGLGAKHDIMLARVVREGLGDGFPFMVDASHCYPVDDACYADWGLDELEASWFEESVAPEDRDGCQTLRSKLTTQISGGEAEFSRWGWRDLIEGQYLNAAQPEMCGTRRLRSPQISSCWRPWRRCLEGCSSAIRCGNSAPPTAGSAITCSSSRSTSRDRSSRVAAMLQFRKNARSRR